MVFTKLVKDRHAPRCLWSRKSVAKEYAATNRRLLGTHVFQHISGMVQIHGYRRVSAICFMCVWGVRVVYRRTRIENCKKESLFERPLWHVALWSNSLRGQNDNSAIYMVLDTNQGLHRRRFWRQIQGYRPLLLLQKSLKYNVFL